jgi:PAS domain S-box-containing protein
MESKNIHDKLFALRQEYLARLEEKISQLKNHWEEICAASGKLDLYPDFQRQFHNMRGTAGTYGCPELSEVAAEIEILLIQHSQNNACINADGQLQITNLLNSMILLAKICGARGSQSKVTPSPFREIIHRTAHQLPLLYLVDDDHDFCNSMKARLNGHFSCICFNSKNDFIAALEEQLPDAVVMDMMLPEGDLAGADAALELASCHPVPLIFVSVRDDEESRLAAIRSGADGYFLKQDDPARMIALLDQLITHSPVHPYRVLVIDDDIELCRLYEVKFHSVGIDVFTVNTPVGALEKIKQFAPDMILLDISMPEINGLELGALIRQYPDYNHIPIVYLTASAGDDIQLATMRLGGDDFLTKPLDTDYLMQYLLARLARVRVTRQGEHKLQEALSELQYIQQGLNNHSIVSIADLAGRITYANERFCEISGYSQQELIGSNHRLLKSGQHSNEFYTDIWTTIASGHVWKGEIVNRKKSGSFYTVLSTIIPVLDDFGLPQRYLSVRTDISQVKELSNQLSKEQERLSLALEATNTGIWEWDLLSNKTLYDANWCHLLGYPNSVQLSWPRLIHSDDFHSAFEKLNAMIDNKTQNYQSEHRKQNATGGWDWVLEAGKVVAKDKDGSPTRIMGTVQIINDRKSAEIHSTNLKDQLNQSIKMESVGHLTAGIAHDFNNILGAMLGYVELSQALVANGQQFSIEKLGRYLGMIKASGVRAKELIAQMLTFSRLSPDGTEAEAPVSLLTPIVKEVVSLLRSAIPRTVDLNYRLEEEGLKARIQPVHLHQIILNLGINARDAMTEYGRIEIVLGKQSVRDAVCASCQNSFTGEFVKITVKDSGCGIPEAVLNKIFDPFFTTKGVGKGTGMGLSVVHGLVHGLGGHIQIKTGIDSGTEINILLPQELISEATVEAVADNKLSGNIKGAMIMVVDDEQAMATMFHEFLSIQGAHIISFTDPLLALEAFSQNPNSIDLVITDEAMPGLSGMHLAQRLLAYKAELPIILCTGYSQRADEETVAKVGIAALFYKPLKMNELLLKIEALLSHKRNV